MEMLLWMLTLTMRELNERPLYEIVKLIKESKKVSCNSDYVRNFMNTLETDLEKELMNLKAEASGAFTALTDWRHLKFFRDRFRDRFRERTNEFEGRSEWCIHCLD